MIMQQYMQKTKESRNMEGALQVPKHPSKEQQLIYAHSHKALAIQSYSTNQQQIRTSLGGTMEVNSQRGWNLASKKEGSQYYITN